MEHVLISVEPKRLLPEKTIFGHLMGWTAGPWDPRVLVLVICPRQAGCEMAQKNNALKKIRELEGHISEPPGGPGLRTGREEQGGEAEAGLGEELER